MLWSSQGTGTVPREASISRRAEKCRIKDSNRVAEIYDAPKEERGRKLNRAAGIYDAP